MNDEELETLANRCLIDLQHMTVGEKDQLRIEVGNIMKCISLVSEPSSNTLRETAAGRLGTKNSCTEEEMYDLPRGFMELNCPVRNETAESQAWEVNGIREEAEYIFSSLTNKTTKVQNESGQYETFFAIQAPPKCPS